MNLALIVEGSISGRNVGNENHPNFTEKHRIFLLNVKITCAGNQK